MRLEECVHQQFIHRSFQNVIFCNRLLIPVPSSIRFNVLLPAVVRSDPPSRQNAEDRVCPQFARDRSGLHIQCEAVDPLREISDIGCSTSD